MSLREAIILEDPIEAEVVESALTQENIPYQLRRFRDSALDMLFTAQRAWGVIQVDEADLEDALRIIDECLRAKPPIPEGEFVPPAPPPVAGWTLDR